MAEQAAQALDDGKAEAEPAVAVFAREPVELAEDVAPLVFRNPRPAIADLDAKLIASPATADNDPARGRVAHRVGDEVEHDALEQDEVAPDPDAARDHPE